MTEEQKKALYAFCKNIEKMICSAQKDCGHCYENGCTCSKYLLAELRDSLGLDDDAWE